MDRLGLPNWSVGREDNMQFVPNGKISVLQIGAYVGDTTQWLLDNRDIEFIDDVDIWENIENDQSQGRSVEGVDMSVAEKLYDLRFKDNKKVFKYKMSSDKFFANADDSKLYDFIYVDGSHTALQTALDGLNSFRLLKPGGVLAFDDYMWDYEIDHFLRPKRGIDAVLNICQDKYKRINVPNRSWSQVWIQKNH